MSIAILILSHFMLNGMINILLDLVLVMGTLSIFLLVYM